MFSLVKFGIINFAVAVKDLFYVPWLPLSSLLAVVNILGIKGVYVIEHPVIFLRGSNIVDRKGE